MHEYGHGLDDPLSLRQFEGVSPDERLLKVVSQSTPAQYLQHIEQRSVYFVAECALPSALLTLYLKQTAAGRMDLIAVVLPIAATTCCPSLARTARRQSVPTHTTQKQAQSSESDA